MTTEKNIAHIGLGYWGKNILRNLSEMNVLHSACDSDMDVISDNKKEFPNVCFTTSVEDILKNPEIKAVTIASPAVTHYNIVKDSILAGKDVFVEKPLALTVREGEELIKLAQEKNRVLMVGHILQYHPALIKLKELISKSELGKVQYIYSNRLNIGKLRVEENILWSFAPHDISAILMLLDAEPENVSSFGGRYINKHIYDTTVTTLDFKSSVKAHIFVSWLHPYKEQKLIVVGTEAMAVFDDVSEEKLCIYPHKIEWESGAIPIAQKAEKRAIEIKKKEPLREELKHFIDCVIERKTPKTGGHEALRVLRVLELAEKSLGENQNEQEKS